MNIPEDLKYTKNDESIKVEGGENSIGITDYAQDQLSDIVYLEISLEINAVAKQGELFGSVESVKAAADVYLPVSGKIVGRNDVLSESPETINDDPYIKGWIVKLSEIDEAQLSDLMDASEYAKYLEGRDA